MVRLPLFLKYPQQKNVKVVCIGDSNTSYNQHSILECSDSSNWTNLVGLQLNIGVINKGISGNTSAQLLARFQSDVIALKPTHCIIEEGGNDTFQSVDVSTTMANIAQMVALCKQNHIIPLVMCCTPQFNVSTWYTLNQNNTAVKALAKQWPINWEDADKLPAIRSQEQSLCIDQGIQYIDVFTPATLTPFSQNLALYNQRDQVHPNTAGYMVMAQAAIGCLQEVI